MSNSNVNKPGLDYLRQSSDRLAADAIKKLKASVSAALTEFGCPAPKEGSGDWFHQDGKTILRQLISDDPSSGWPFWIWDQCTNKVLKVSEDSLINKNIASELTEFSPVDFKAVSAPVTFGEGDEARTYTAHGSLGSSLGGEHVQVLSVVADDGENLPEFNEAELSAIRLAIKAKAEEDDGE